MTIRVLIADDQAMVRAGFAMILAAEDDIEVVGEAKEGVHAVELAERHRPDVVLMDIRMPRMDGLEALRRLPLPGTVIPPKVVAVTTVDDDEYVQRALSEGASGVLIKDSGPALLVEAIRAAASGEALVSPAITVRLLRRLNSAVPAPREPHTALSARENELVRLVARGLTNAEIATRLTISVSTVKTHLANVQLKLSARNRVEIAAWAWESGAVDGRGREGGPTSGTGPAHEITPLTAGGLVF
ncbi:response regulator [Streptomyces sp. A5-4]|uniref:response regulator n=1 Tax=Streptomyces sp. A5-4 TaxID=3384771 RepID=UPI003DA7EAC1